MKPCVIIPCYNHWRSVAAVAAAARAHCPVIVIDDGSTMPLPALAGCQVTGLDRHRGKGAALRAGMERAGNLGFTHAISMDADGQHFASNIPQFFAVSEAQPNALVIGRRDFYGAQTPAARRRSNAISNFFFRAETGGIRLDDTQCGFRSYPISLARSLNVRSGGFAYEYEFLVRAAWAGAAIATVPIQCVYRREHLLNSRFRPLRDFAHIAMVNAGLLLQSWFVRRDGNSKFQAPTSRKTPSPKLQDNRVLERV